MIEFFFIGLKDFSLSCRNDVFILRRDARSTKEKIRATSSDFAYVFFNLSN